MTKKIVYGFFYWKHLSFCFWKHIAMINVIKKKKKNHRDKELPSSIELKLESPQNSIKSSALLILLRERWRWATIYIQCLNLIQWMAEMSLIVIPKTPTSRFLQFYYLFLLFLTLLILFGLACCILMCISFGNEFLPPK